VDRILASWAALASHFIGDCFDLARPYIDKAYDGLDPLVRFVAAQLYIDCHLSSESVLLLVREQKEWDADIIARSVLEGSLKLTYLLEGTAEEGKAKAHEYWYVLPLFHTIRRSERARQLLDAVLNPDGPEWQPFRALLVESAEVAEVRARFSRKERQSLEEKWSFSGLCRAFAQTGQSERGNLAHLAHGYGMSSHLLHKDADGIGMVWDRYGRDPGRQNAAKLGHTARLVAEICAFSQLRLFALLRACKQSTEAMKGLEDRYAESLFTELKKASSQFIDVEYGART
jgi:hypothetical protein